MELSIEAQKKLYEANRHALEESPCCFGVANLPAPISDQIVLSVMQEGHLYKCHYHGREVVFKLNSLEKEFYQQAYNGSPILLTDAYDVKKIVWMCDRLRPSNRYGKENRLFLYFHSLDIFVLLGGALDWRPVLATGKVVMLFGMKELHAHYPPQEDAKPCKHILVDEIVELVHTSNQRGWSGNQFMSTVMDCHPYLINNGRFGLSAFGICYNNYLKEKTVKQAVASLKSITDETGRKIMDADLSNLLFGYEGDAVRRRELFYECLPHSLEQHEVPSAIEWFKAFFLASAEAVGREFTGRITPVLYHDFHYAVPFAPQGKFSAAPNRAFMDELFTAFSYRHVLTVVREPLNRAGACIDYQIKAKQTNRPMIWDIPLRGVLSFMQNDQTLYVGRDEPLRKIWAVVRFEDLKMFPKATTLKICEFLHLPWDESLLSCTVNGEMDRDLNFEQGFSLKAVTNKHITAVSELDRYRLDLLHGDDYASWGYRRKFEGKMAYTQLEIMQLFALPYKCEAEELVGSGAEEKHRRVHDEIREYALRVLSKDGRLVPKDKNGADMVPVTWLKPQVKEEEKLFE